MSRLFKNVLKIITLNSEILFVNNKSNSWHLIQICSILIEEKINK